MPIAELLAADGWRNARVVYDAAAGWMFETIGGDVARFLTEQQALAIIRYLKRLQQGLRVPARLP